MKETELAKLLPKNEYREFPKWRYSPDNEPVLVANEAEQDELGEDWFDKPDFTNNEFDISEAFNNAKPAGYVAVEYPKWKYAVGKDAALVNSADEEAALEGEWFDSPDCKASEPELTKEEFDAAKAAEAEDKAAKKAAKKAADAAKKEDEADGDVDGNQDPDKVKKAAKDADDLI